MKRILVVAAHPDDEILGCGGTIARLIKEGCEAYTLILGEGKTSRDISRNINKRRKELQVLKNESVQANTTIGIKKVIFKNLPDNRFDGRPLLDIVKIVEKIKNEIKPDIFFTHFYNDLNIDHRITYNAVVTASRPIPGESVKEIYAFEVASSTEWNYPTSFTPTLYFDISDFISLKLEAMKFYKSELKKYPHPRSVEGISISAQNRGLQIGVKFAEAFQCVRIIK